ncbi:hypothetical protein F2Q69_00055745 [Brassica cretica]|uniref:Uncharacterized protein n=1 Tax=Brassica cretica TaxID=69181 RepID=A0A8S9N3A6_BRACR|nr:hypothetical protein F2Q69_00055745 [Brassica cretica]
MKHSMQLDTQKHEVSQYLRFAHANRHAEARVSRCMNTRHAEGQVYVEVSSGMSREHAKGQVYPHVSPRMQPEACGTTHRRLGEIETEVEKESRRFRAVTRILESFRGPKYCREVPKDCPEEKEGSFQVLISPDQFIQDIEVGFWGLTSRVYLVLVLFCENLVVVLVVIYRSLLPQMPPASPIEDWGTAIPIEERDRAIPKRLRLCGVIVKGLLVSLTWRKNDYFGS